MNFLSSPTDQKLGTLLSATTSSVPERYGVDILASTTWGLAGWQRKTTSDLTASVVDGRLTREVAAMKRLHWATLIHEGRPAYTSDGYLMEEHQRRWTRMQLRNLLRSCWYRHGIRVENTDDLQDTATAIKEMVQWMNKKGHRSLLNIPKGDTRNNWHQEDRNAWGRMLLQGFPGIGYTRADAIVSHFGRVPLEWTVSKKELEEVYGIGPLTAKELWESLI